MQRHRDASPVRPRPGRGILWLAPVLVAGILPAAAQDHADPAGGPMTPPAAYDHGLADGAREDPTALVPFFPAVDCDPAIPSPAEYLGFPVGAHPVRHGEVVGYLRLLAERSPRVRMISCGRSHEGRALFAALVTSEANMARLGEIKQALARLADPRMGAAPDLADLPVAIWMGACVHGDEMSGTDAALVAAHWLAAGRDAATVALREKLLVLIDPLQNPDGRDRYISQITSLSGIVPDGDDQSLRHDGHWTRGRTNHYFFDLNRDWCLATQPETIGRLRLIASWHPQIVIDAHEMSGQSTFLFSPPREPFNTMITENTKHWWRTFSVDHAAAFDRAGFAYYTREWHEEWYPGYASSWSTGIGAIGLLYEQARVDGSRLARLDGTILTFRETVQRQLTSFWANLQTAAQHDQEILETYRAEREREIKAARGGYAILPHDQPERARALLQTLLTQGIEVYASTAPHEVGGLRAYWTDGQTKATLPVGTLFVPSRQPHGRLLETILAFDPQMGTDFLASERHRLEREGLSRLYDVSGWSVSLAAGLPIYHAAKLPTRDLERLDAGPLFSGELRDRSAGFGFALDARDDRMMRALVQLWEAGCVVQASEEAFTAAGAEFSRGSLLIKRAIQPEGLALEQHLARIAAETGVTIIGLPGALVEEGADLGSRKYRLLKRPKVAVLAGAGVGWYEYGAIAWLLDHELRMPYVPLAAERIDQLDLVRYNTIVMPGHYEGPEAQARHLGSAGLRKLKSWVHDGGTLIALGAGAACIADSSSGLGTVGLRRQHLGEIAGRTSQRLSAVKTGEEAPSPRSARAYSRSDIDPAAFETAELKWAKSPGAMDGLLTAGLPAFRRPEPFWAWAAGKSSQALEEEDRRLRLYHPRGAALKVDLDEWHWLTAGCAVLGREDEPLFSEAPGGWFPARLFGEYALVAAELKTVVAAFAPEDSLRLSGLLWPEARERWAQTAYLTRERVGKGQVILFVAHPCQRGTLKATERAFLNAVMLAPGMGTARPWPW